jgi:hypothetical protein
LTSAFPPKELVGLWTPLRNQRRSFAPTNGAVHRSIEGEIVREDDDELNGNLLREQQLGIGI